jgi:hypothetical protein
MGNGILVGYPDEEHGADAFDEALEAANKMLRDLYSEMTGAMQDAERQMESVEYFIDTAEGNGWAYEANGEMRNV